MAVERDVKEYCAHNLVAIIMRDIKVYFPDADEDKLLADFTSSETYSKLFKEETGLWAEGSDYIMNMYLDERGISFGGASNV